VALSDATATRPLEWSPPRTAVSRVPYLPGLDGMRAIAVLAVMVYHANNQWLPGGFLGVEVFFVISGYLITLLLIGEHERTGTVSLRHFYLRRARRLLPALFLLLIGLSIYCALFRRDVLGQLRGDVVAALTYSTNWYQIWVGQSYTATGDFSPLRHLWSLAIEEQFYLVWPLVMIALIRRGRRRLPEMAGWLFLAAVAVTVVTAVIYYPGEVNTCALTPEAYWKVGERCISKTDTLYLSTFTRAGGLLLGAAFALVWRPVAVMRGPLRTKGRLVDLVALVGLAGLAALFWYLHIITPENTADPWLFRGGFFVTGLATLALIAGVTHRRALAGALLGNSVLLWIGLRSYGIYLFHWPIYQGIREVTGRPLTVSEFVLALALTAVVCELSYRLVEMPVRRRHVGRWWRRLQARRDPVPRRIIAAAGAGLVALSVFAATNLATAELKQNEIAQSLAEGEQSVTDLAGITGTTTPATVTPGTQAPTTPPPTTTPPPASVPAGAGPGATVPPTAAPASAAPTTAAPTTVPPTTLPPTTTAPPAPIQTLAIGDSVMLGAAPAMRDAGVEVVDAAVSRQMVDMVPVVQALRDQQRLGDAVIVHLGTNGPIGDDTLTAFFDALKKVRRVLVLQVAAPGKSWIGPNNQKLAALPDRFPNVRVINWPELSTRCVDDCFYADGIHLKSAGQRYYANTVMYFLGR
jgi:peptidoglycan/LPS O-acetylase OafA/YrhL